MDESQNTDTAEAEQADFPSLPSRLFNVFLSPGRVMEAVAKHPVWAGALLVGALLVALQTALIPLELILATQRQAMLEAGRDMPEMPETLMNVMRFVTPILATIGVSLFTFISAGLYWLIFAFVLGDEGRYRQYLSVGAHALFVPAVIGLTLVPLKVMTEDPQATLNLGLFLFFVSDGYWADAFRLMDLTGLWSALIVAQGAHSIDPRRSFGSAAAIVIGITLAFALIFAIFQP
jgi:hypothetical protein